MKAMKNSVTSFRNQALFQRSQQYLKVLKVVRQLRLWVHSAAEEVLAAEIIEMNAEWSP